MYISDIHSEEELLREIEQEDDWLDDLDQIAMEEISEIMDLDEDISALDEESYLFETNI